MYLRPSVLYADGADRAAVAGCFRFRQLVGRDLAAMGQTVIVGSGLGGVAGMLLGVPVCAVIYDEIRRTMRKKEAALTVSDNDAQ